MAAAANHSEKNAAQVGGAGITPNPTIQIKSPKNEQLQKHYPIQGLLQFRRKVGWQFKIET